MTYISHHQHEKRHSIRFATFFLRINVFILFCFSEHWAMAKTQANDRKLMWIARIETLIETILMHYTYKRHLICVTQYFVKIFSKSSIKNSCSCSRTHCVYHSIRWEAERDWIDETEKLQKSFTFSNILLSMVWRNPFTIKIEWEKNSNKNHTNQS